MGHKGFESLHTTFANKQHTRIICLQDQLARITKKILGLIVPPIDDKHAIGGAPITDVQHNVRILPGLVPDYDTIFTAIRSHETLITFELYEKLLDYEIILMHEESK